MNTDDSLLNINVKRLPEAFFNNIEEMTQRDVAFVVANTLLGESISSESLRNIVEQWIESDATFRQVGSSMYAYEYLSGPTMSIYDLHARLLALLMADTVTSSKIVCCSKADSSAAVCQAFKSVTGCSPYILQAVGVLSDLEKRQLVSIVPNDKLCVVKCDEATLEILSQRAVAHISDQSIRLITDDNAYYRVSRVAMLFDMYRRLKILQPDKKFVFACDKTQRACMDACTAAIEMGLPVRIVETVPDYDRDQAIKQAYTTTGYILSPRAVEQWVSLKAASLESDEVGVFVQPSHPAKRRKLLEPLINQVIPLPHKLYFNPSVNLRYKFNAPTVNTIINFLTN